MRRLIAVFITGLVLQGCSGNSSSTRFVGTPEEELKVSGRVGTSLQSARVSATPINLEGGPERVTNDSGGVVFDGPASLSDTSGNYEVVIDADDEGSALVFIATEDNGAASYRCERPAGCSGTAYLSVKEISGDLDIRAGVGEIAAGMVVNVNWLTDFASSLAKTVYIDAVTNGLSADDRQDIDAAVLSDVRTAKTGVYNEYTMELANLHVAEMFGISDIIYTTPTGPSQITKDTPLSGERLIESIYVGALVASMPTLADSEGVTFMDIITEIADDAIARKGQLLEKGAGSSALTLHDIFSRAAQILNENISYYKGTGARVPGEAESALARLVNRANSFVSGRETSVDVDVPERLASWSTNIELTKEFITDLTFAIKNFWAETPDKPSFVDYDHARRMDSYYLAHENLYVLLEPLVSGENGILSEIMGGVEALVECQFGAGNCVPLDTGLEIITDPDDSAGRSSDRVVINDSLMLIMRPVADPESSGGTYKAFDFEFDATLNSLTKGGTEFSWFIEAISDGSVVTLPYLRLFYSERYATPPSFGTQEPDQIALVWPLVSFDRSISGASNVLDNGEHHFDIQLEANLVGVNDPLDALAETRYNPLTLVARIQSSRDVDVGNVSEVFMQLRTTNAFAHYPQTKWSTRIELFNGRSGVPATIPDMVTSLYRGQEVLGNGTIVDVFDEEVIGSDFISRIRLYPYNPSTGATKSQSCDVEIINGVREAQNCSEPLSLAGNISLDELIENNFNSGSLETYVIPANGQYTIDLVSEGIVDGAGNFLGLNPGTEYGPFDGTYKESVEMGVDRFSLTANSFLVDQSDTIIPVTSQFSLQKQTSDIYSLTLGYSYGAEDQFSNISEQIGVGVGGDAQGFILEYAVSEEELTAESGATSTIEVERGAWTIYRTGVTLGGDEQSVLTQIVTRAEYTQGNAEEACGVNDRDKLSSAGDCDAVAYLTFRGSLVATIREERENVFVARFVDGTWMILGG